MLCLPRLFRRNFTPQGQWHVCYAFAEPGHNFGGCGLRIAQANLDEYPLGPALWIQGVKPRVS